MINRIRGLTPPGSPKTIYQTQSKPDGTGLNRICDTRSLRRALIVSTAAFVWLLLLGGPIVQAQQKDELPDKVILTPNGRTSSRVTLKGEIVDYNGDVLRIRLQPGQPYKEFPASEVVEILTPQLTAHEKGIEFFDKKDYVEADKLFRKALDQEGRTWVKREILTRLVRCALMQGDYFTATSKFAVLIRSDPRTPAFALIPLIWSEQPPNPELTQQAKGWLLDKNQPAPVRLMGASILLQEPETQPSALVVLRELAANSDRRLGVLATCQQWRVRLASRKEINPTELKTWEQRLETLPEELQGGSRLLLGRAYASRREFELAALHLLWTPLAQPADHFLSARAMVEAGDALVTIGQLEAGARLYEEASSQYATTPAGEEAKIQLEALLEKAVKK